MRMNMNGRLMRSTGVMMLLLAMSLGGGCMVAIGTRGQETSEYRHVRTWHDSRVPAKAKLVAYGQAMRFTAPREGMVYLVNAKKHELVVATTLGEGESFEVRGNSVTYGGQRHTQAGWRIAFDDHELYFAPVDWHEPGGRRLEVEVDEGVE